MNLISAVERYQQHQVLGNGLHEQQKQDGLHAPGQIESSVLSDEFVNSGQALEYQTVATQFHPEAITFPDILSLRQALYDHSLINLREANTLVVATQTYPDNQTIDLPQALEQYQQQDSSYEANLDVARLKVVAANIIAAQDS